jgi:hypothetical protein
VALKNISIKKYELDLIVLLILCYLFRATIPFLKFPFVIIFAVLIVNAIIYHRSNMLVVVRNYFRRFYLIIILALIILISFLLSNKLYLSVFKEIVNTMTLLMLFFLMMIYIKSKEDLFVFNKKLLVSIIAMALIISLRLLMLNLLFLFSSGNSLSANASVMNSEITSITSDYNFALLSVFFGILAIIFYLKDPRELRIRYFLNLLLIIFLLTIIISGSRRGIFTIAGVMVTLLTIQLISILKDSEILKSIASGTKWFLINSFILLFIITGFVFIMPVQFRKTVLKTVGVNVNSYKQLTSAFIYKYSTVFSNKEYLYYQKLIWNEKFDPKNPDSGWASHISSRVFPIIGENAGIVPNKSIGYKMDSSCDASTWSNNAYSYTDISNLYKSDSKTGDNEFYDASVYCYVSNDFDATWAYIFTEGATSGKAVQSYDFNRKGVWQRLNITFKNKNGPPPVYLFWAKSGVTDFAAIKGYIIFAYPEYKKIAIDENDPILWGTRISTSVFPLSGQNVSIVPDNAIGYKMDSTSDASTWSNNAYSFTNISSIYHGNPTISFDTYSASVYCFVSADFNGSWANISAEGKVSGKYMDKYDLGKKGSWQKLQINFISETLAPPVYLYWAIGGVTDFSTLKGYIVFACPHYEKVMKNDSISSILLVPSRLNTIFYVSHYQISAGFIESALPLLIELTAIKSDKDPIRRLAAKLISEDTTYFGYKNAIFVDSFNNKFAGDRMMRWKFAGQIFSKEFNLKQKMFGGGFNYLNWFGFYFLNNKKLSDYPHNPFLSVLLYSGIFGLIIYLVFMFKVFYYYIRYFREYYILSMFFFITFFFSFFSAGSPFDPPIMGFFVILPFFLHYVHKRSEPDGNNKIS